jgi:hypothetical protein
MGHYWVTWQVALWGTALRVLGILAPEAQRDLGASGKLDNITKCVRITSNFPYKWDTRRRTLPWTNISEELYTSCKQHHSFLQHEQLQLVSHHHTSNKSKRLHKLKSCKLVPGNLPRWLCLRPVGRGQRMKCRTCHQCPSRDQGLHPGLHRMTTVRRYLMVCLGSHSSTCCNREGDPDLSNTLPHPPALAPCCTSS